MKVPLKGLIKKIWNLKAVQAMIPDALFYKIKYRVVVGQALDLKNPVTLREKLQWLKLYDRKEIYHMMVDKVAVRDYVKEKLGEEYLVPRYGVYDSFEAIDFSVLPDQFVLKPNHTSGDIFICSDKAELDLSELKGIVNRWLERDFYAEHREWPYKGLPRKIICEKLLDDGAEYGLRDYKFRCFHGKMLLGCVCSERLSASGMKVDYLDRNWNLLPFTRHYANSGKPQAKPVTYEKMVEFAERLSEDLIFSRIDFYEVDEQLYFGEITFYPASGYYSFDPEKYGVVYGDYLDLP